MVNKLRSIFVSNWRHILSLSLVYLFLCVVFYRWFGPGYFVNGDTWLVNKESAKYTFAPFVWEGFQDIGIFMTEIPFMLIYYISSLPTLFFNLEFNAFTIKFLFFFPYILVAPLGMYLLSYKLTKNILGSAVASLIYTVNIPILTSFAMGHLHITVPQAFLPLILLSMIIYFEKEEIIPLLLTTIFLLLTGLYEFRFFYIAYIVLSLFIIYQVIVFRGKNFKKALKLFIVVSAAGLLFNLFWLLPLLFSSTNYSANPILNRPLFGSEFLSVLNPLTLFHPYWTPNEVSVFTSQIIPSVFLLFPALAIMGYLLNRKNKLLLFFLIILILGLTLTKASNPPFETLYSKLYTHLPGFKLFRESTKFFYFVALSYSVLTAFLIKWLSETRSKYLYIVVAAVLFVTSYIALPVLTGKAKALFVPVNIQDDSYPILNDFLRKENKNTYFRILQVPTASSLNYVSDTMPNLHLPFVYGLWHEQFQMESPIKINGLSDFLLFPQLENLLSLYATRYLILPKSHSYLDGNIFYWYEEREIFLKKLDSLPYLRKVNIGTNKITVYEVKYIKPHLYITSEEETLYKKIDYERVDFEEINPTKYIVRINNLKNTKFLNFSEAYNSNWNLRIGTFKWFEVVKPNYFLSDTLHLQNNAKLNSFRLDPEYIKNHFAKSEYNINPDGGIDLELTLYFKPQSYFYFGVLISVLTLIFILTGLFYAFKKN